MASCVWPCRWGATAAPEARSSSSETTGRRSPAASPTRSRLPRRAAHHARAASRPHRQHQLARRHLRHALFGHLQRQQVRGRGSERELAPGNAALRSAGDIDRTGRYAQPAPLAPPHGPADPARQRLRNFFRPLSGQAGAGRGQSAAAGCGRSPGRAHPAESAPGHALQRRHVGSADGAALETLAAVCLVRADSGCGSGGLMKTARALLLLSVALSAVDAGASREVAITIDDLPRGGDAADKEGRTFREIRGMTERLLAPFGEQQIPVTGFVHPGRTELAAPDLRRILDLWLDAGAELGNHTWSHADLNRTPVADYEQDILKAEAFLRPVVEAHGKKLEFFRYPMLHAGPTAESKRAIQEFLAAHHYRNAPVTFDDSDYMFAALYTHSEYRARVAREYVPYLESVVAFFEKRSVEVVGREFPQIMLLHANELNSRMMPDILDMFRRRGYRFISLDEALKDSAYKLPESYVGAGGFSWIHRWSMTKGMPNKGEPDEPEWVRKAFTEEFAKPARLVRPVSGLCCKPLACPSRRHSWLSLGTMALRGGQSCQAILPAAGRIGRPTSRPTPNRTGSPVRLSTQRLPHG